MSIYIGIDTSNYKTSLAASDSSGNIVFNSSEYLEVPGGKRGLRQQEAFFKHSMKLPDRVREMFQIIDASEVAAVGVSDKPRRQQGSYMPCFMAGVSAAKYISSALGVPLYSFSHQEGHAAAVIPENTEGRSIFFHLSGGTTEYLLCTPDAEGFDMQIAGGTKDISFGMLLDRFGVELGLPFPSGSYIDSLAAMHVGSDANHAEGLMPKIGFDEGYFNLSGPETRLITFARDYLQNHGKIENTADLTYAGSELAAASYEIFKSISNLLTKSAVYLSDKYKVNDVFMAGGVASSSLIRKLISEDRSAPDVNILFGEPGLSGDNAVGISLLASRVHRGLRI